MKGKAVIAAVAAVPAGERRRVTTRRQLSALGLACLAAAALGAAAVAGPTATKQRIVIEGRIDIASSTGTFALTPLTAGPLKPDSGSLRATGTVKPAVVRKNGQRVTVIVGQDDLKGKLGTFSLVQRVESVDAGFGYSSDRGTWSLRAGTGVYSGLRGSGTFAAVGLPGGLRLVYREDGYVAKG